MNAVRILSLVACVTASAVVDPLTIYRVSEDGSRKATARYFGGASVRSIALAAGIPANRLRGDAELWRTRIEGDVLLREPGITENPVLEVEAVFVEKLGPNVRLTKVIRQEPVYVVTGKFVANPAGQKDGLPLYVFSHGGVPDREPNGASYTTVAGLMSTVAGCVSRSLVIEADLPNTGAVGHVFEDPDHTTDWSRFPFQNSSDDEAILKTVSKQTGLTFTKEVRAIEVYELKMLEE